MKKWIYVILSIFMLSFYTGCKDTEVNVMDVEEIIDINDTILVNKKRWGTSDNLFEIPIRSLDDIQGSQLCRFKNDLLNSYYTYDRELKKSFYHVNKISILNGEVIASIELDNMITPEIQVLEHHIVLKDLDKKKAYLYDENLSLVNEYEFDSHWFVFDQKADKAIVFIKEQGIQLIDLNKNTKGMVLDNVRDITLCELNDKFVTFTYIDPDSFRRRGAVLDIESEDILKLSLEETPAYLEYTGDNWLVRMYSDNSKYTLIQDNQIDYLQVNNIDSMSMIQDSNHLMHKSFNDDWKNILYLYDHSGKFISSTELMGTLNNLEQDMVWYEEYNGYFFTLMSEEDSMDRLLFWDLSIDTEDKELLYVNDRDIYLNHIVAEKYYEQARFIGDEYGIDILIAEQCETLFPDHSANLLLEAADIEIALNTLEETLSVYPEGFFEQLKHDVYDTIQIQLTGMLTKDTSTEDITYISQGFVFAKDNKLVMVLDSRGTHSAINQPLKNTIFHEMSHLIEKKLEFRSRYVEKSVYSDEKWNELNPDGFEYYGHYYGVLMPEYRDYFIDHYACSNSNEDRARIMEYALSGKLTDYLSSSGIMNKYEYYCKSIRDGFDSDDWEEVTWERFADKN